MIRFDNGISLDFMNMGLFIGGDAWIHPEISTPTYELIFVTSGEVYIEEDGKYYHLTKGDLICLRPGVIHRGYRETNGASFFWVHFFAGNYDKIGVWLYHADDPYNYSLFFRQLGHLAREQSNKHLVECKLCELLFEIARSRSNQSKLFYDICEYIRVNVASAPSVKAISERYNYSADYLSRVFKVNCGISLKSYLDMERNAFVKHLLLSTNMTIKEISYAAAFESDNALIKFFKYHNRTSPTAFRNSYYSTHTNNK